MAGDFSLDGRARQTLMVVGLIAAVLTLIATVTIMIDINYGVATAIGSVLALWCLGVVVIITRRMLVDRRERRGS